jgi:hypothetical protein
VYIFSEKAKKTGVQDVEHDGDDEVLMLRKQD